MNLTLIIAAIVIGAAIPGIPAILMLADGQITFRKNKERNNEQ